MEKLKIPHLEFHVAHSCNLTCEGCAHFSNHGHQGIISYEELKQWFSHWHKRISPTTMDILGGEPLLNKKIVDIVYLTREMWDDSNLKLLNLQTNGMLLYKYPDLPKALKETNIRLTLSKHGNSGSYLEKFNAAEKIMNDWKQEYGIETGIADCYNHWFTLYKGYGKNITPFEDNDPQKSWDNCITGQDCFTLNDNSIYKCAPLAYLPHQASKYKISNKWDYYLTYTPLQPGCTDEELAEFFSRKCESYCSMCPANPEKFQSRDPLTPRTVYELENKAE